MAKAAQVGWSRAGTVIPNSKFSIKTLIPGLSCFRQHLGWMVYNLSEVMHLPLFKASYSSVPVSKLLLYLPNSFFAGMIKNCICLHFVGLCQSPVQTVQQIPCRLMISWE